MTKIKNHNQSLRLFYRDGIETDSLEDPAIREQLHHIRLALQAPYFFDGNHCIVCEEAIPLERLRLSMFRCLSCQMKSEEKSQNG